MTSSTSAYTYTRLGHDRGIRLIRLPANATNDRLVVDIEPASLDDQNLDYIALSYVWGPTEPSTHIACDAAGSTLEVGPNLFRILNLLVQQQNFTDRLYIDRLCIDQGDLNERAQQVTLMGEIFSRAKMVIVWLGDSTNTTKLAFDTITDINQQLVRQDKINDNGRGSDHSIRYPAFDDPAALAIRQILGMDWFNRVWTFQEIVLAKNAILKCGNYHMPWSYLSNLLTGLEKYPPGPTYQSGFLRGPSDAAFEMVKNQAYRRMPNLDSYSTGRANVSLMALLHELRKRQATDPRDKVYALLNASLDISTSDLKPNYRLSPLEVYASTAKVLLGKHDSLAFLGLVEKKDHPDLVSWVPDFRSKDDMNFLHQMRLTFRPTQQIWRASGSSSARQPSADTPLLHLPVHGICIGKVVAMTDPPGNLIGSVALGAKVLDGGQWHAFARTAGRNDRYPPTNEPIDLAFNRTRIWDCLPDEAARRRSRPQPLTLDDFPAFNPPSATTAIENLNNWQLNDMASRILNGTTRKRMVRTDTGYLGLARRCVALGDELWVLMGFDTPCALRKVGGELYCFGGEAYVHGAMDGEMLLRAAKRRAMDEPIHSMSDGDKTWLDGLATTPDVQKNIPVTELILV